MVRSLKEIQEDLDICTDKAENFDLLQEYKDSADKILKEINECTDDFYVYDGPLNGNSEKPIFRVHPGLPKNLVGPIQIINSLSYRR